jgi:hypothetical protein
MSEVDESPAETEDSAGQEAEAEETADEATDEPDTEAE